MKTVYVGMSGGVDSSVAAALLKRQGYLVTGVYMKNWIADVAGVACSWRQDLDDARAAAAVLDIPFKVMDFQKEYRRQVVDVMVAEYAAGRTPNPDVLCNQEIKFRLFLEAARAGGAELTATGHYARTEGGRLFAAADVAKDQTYFLYRVTARALRHALFPLGELTKPEVRRLAAELGLPTADKPDSQGICFVGEVGIKEFLRQYAPAELIHPGPIILRAADQLIGQPTGQSIGQPTGQSIGQTVGRHDGALFYTIGQRHGLGIGGGRPYFVTGKDMAANTVYVTDDSADLELDAAEFIIEQPNWINQPPVAGHDYQIRARYRAVAIPGQVEPLSGSCWRVRLSRPERAVSPGQSAVIYDGHEVLGGGIIA
jgi:tRNA-specific 2-thiouridylase